MADTPQEATNTQEGSGASQKDSNTPKKAVNKPKKYVNTPDEDSIRVFLQIFAESGFILGSTEHPSAPPTALLPQLYSDVHRHLGMNIPALYLREWMIASTFMPTMPAMRLWYLLRPWYNAKKWHPLSDLDFQTRIDIYRLKHRIIDSATNMLMEFSWIGTVGFAIRIRRDWPTGRALAELYTYDCRWARVAVLSSRVNDTVLAALHNLANELEWLHEAMTRPDAPVYLEACLFQQF